MSSLTSFDVLAAVFYFAGQERIQGRFQSMHRVLSEAPKHLPIAENNCFAVRVMYESRLRDAMSHLLRSRVIESIYEGGMDRGHYQLDEIGASYIRDRILPLLSEQQRLELLQLGTLFGKTFGQIDASWNPQSHIGTEERG